MRLDSPAAASLLAHSSASGASAATARARRLPSLFVIDDDYFPLLFGPGERAMLESLASFAHPRHTAADLNATNTVFADVEAIIGSWGMPVLDATMLGRFPRLRVVFYAAGTIKTIVTDTSWRRGIRMTTAALVNAQPVAEFTIAAIVFSLKRVWERVQALRSQHLYQRHHSNIPGCYGTTVGLLALGKIGRRVAAQLRDMEVRVIGYDPYISRACATELGVELRSIEEVFTDSDVVSCHLPLHRGTAQLVDAALLRRMKPNSTLINTARGGVVNEPDLIAILRERPDLYAILDTISDEPPSPDNPLLQLPNAIVTPHLAGSMGRECRRMGIMMVDELRRYLVNEPLLGEVCEQELAILA